MDVRGAVIASLILYVWTAETDVVFFFIFSQARKKRTHNLNCNVFLFLSRYMNASQVLHISNMLFKHFKHFPPFPPVFFFIRLPQMLNAAIPLTHHKGYAIPS